MILAQQLKAVGLGAFPCAVNYNYGKTKWEKHPLTVNRESWRDTADRPINDTAVQWGGVSVLGLPIPPGVVVIDLDTYKPGCTPDSANVILGAVLPWAQAYIQTTISGGSHYAFRLPAWDVRQTDNIGGPGSGVDTRVACKGFICTGEGYTPADSFGVMRLAYPESLPLLPDACRAVLEVPEATAPQRTELPAGNDRDVESLRAALAHIDPTERDTWRDIGFALKHYFHDAEDVGYDLWDAWSSGHYWPDGCPASYSQDTQWSQWSGFKPVKEGRTVTIGTLFHTAMAGGWTPPARFDTSAAFGEGAVSVDTFNGLVQRIMETGADSRNVEGLLADITTSGCNEVQAVLLRNELKAMLKTAKLLDKDLAAVIDRKITPQARTVTSGQYDKNHTENAELFLAANYREDTLIRSDEMWYLYDGRCWVETDDAVIDHQLTMAMLPSRPQKPTINGTYQMLCSVTHRVGVKMNDSAPGLLIFQNGVLDIRTGHLATHDKCHLTTCIMPYNYRPNALAPRWLLFLNEVLEGDHERIALLQEWLGYMMIPSYIYQKIMLLLGAKRSGKGTIGRVLELLVGAHNYSGASLASFVKDDFLDSLRTKTAVFSGDTSKNINRNIVEGVVESIKKISGGDHVDFARKYKGRMSCRLPSRITLAANHVPRLFDDSDALSSRLLVIPFEVSFLDREEHALTEVLFTEIEGIAVWALQGLARLNSTGRFTLPEASKSELQFIAESYSPLRVFIDSTCRLGGDGVMSSIDLYEVYRVWALAEGEDRLLTRKIFISAFKDASRGHGCRYGPHRVDDKVVKGFKGVSIRDVPSVTASAFQPRVVK